MRVRLGGPTRTVKLAAAGVAAALLAACGSSGGPATTAAAGASTTAAGPAKSTGKVEVRLGYFPNVTHASALVGVNKGIFAKDLPAGDTLKTSTFTVGTAEVEAFFAEALDIGFIGPSPTINAFEKSKGDAVRIVGGATSGGASLVVTSTIASPADLKGKKIASPGLGGTQDVALRAYLKAQGLKADTTGGGDVSIVPQDNALTLDAFKSGQIDGGWVPEPWATRLVKEGRGKVLVDEKTLWPQGRWVTTQIVVRTKFLQEHPDAVEGILKGQLEASALIKSDAAAAQAAAGDEIQKITTKAVPPDVLSASFANLEFTNDPVASSLQKQFDDAKSLGLLKDADTPLTTIYDLTILNRLLTADGGAAVTGL